MPRFNQIVREIHRRSVWQVLSVYLVGSWGALQIVDTITKSAGLPDWVTPLAMVLLVVGLPVVLATAIVQRGLPASDAADGSARTPADESAGTAAGGSAQHAAGNLAAGTGSLDRTSTRAPRHRRLLTWRNAVLGGASAFALLALAVAFYFVTRALGVGPFASLVAQGVIDERAPVVLADFNNRSRDPSAGPLVTEALRVDLLDSPVLALIAPARVQELLGMMGRPTNTVVTGDIAREVALRGGFSAVLAGEVTGVGDGYVLTASLVGAETGEILAGFRESADDDDEIVAAIDKLSERIREKLGESLRQIRAAEPLAAVTTNSLPALRRYTEAVQLFERSDYARAIALLDEAVRIDSTFAMANRKLSVALENIGEDPARIREASARAYNHRERLTDIERYLTSARYHETVLDDIESAVQAYENVLAIDPDEPTALNNLALRYQELDRYGDAQPLLERAVYGTGGGTTAARINLINNLIGLAQFDSARATLDRFEADLPVDEAGRPALGIAELIAPIWVGLAALDAETAHESAERLAVDESIPARFRSYGLGAPFAVDVAHGRLGEASRHLQDADRWSLLHGDTLSAVLWSLAHANAVLRIAADTALARALAARVLGGDSWAALSSVRRPYVLAIHLVADLGLVEQAREQLDRWDRASPTDQRGPDYEGARAAANGAILAAAGRLEEALEAYEAALATGRCQRCYRLRMARIHAQRGHVLEAIELFQSALTEPSDPSQYPIDVIVAIERLGPLHEQNGNVDAALEAYARFVELWEDADPELQPRVTAARNRIAILTAEGAE